MQKITKTRAISPSNIAALAAIVEGARKTGKIEAGAIEAIHKAVLRESVMNRNADYMKGKALTVEEARKIAKLLKAPSIQNERAIEKMAEKFRRGDMVQIIEAMAAAGVKGEGIDRAKQQVASPSAIYAYHVEALAKLAESRKVAVNLYTVSMERPTYDGPRIGFDLNTMRFIEAA